MLKDKVAQKSLVRYLGMDIRIRIYTYNILVFKEVTRTAHQNNLTEIRNAENRIN